MRACLLLSVALCCLSAAEAEATVAEVAELKSEQDMLTAVKDLRLSPDECVTLIEAGIARAYWELSSTLIDRCAGDKKVDRKIFAAATKVRQQLTLMSNLVREKGAVQMDKIAPAFEWAQNANTVLISVKWAHKLDAPACIDLVDEELVIKKDRVKLGMTCKSQRKRYELVLPLKREIDTDPKKSYFSKSSVGKGTLYLAKAEKYTRWHKLLSVSKSEQPKNMHVWWSMLEANEKEMQLVDQAQFERENEDLRPNEIAGSRVTVGNALDSEAEKAQMLKEGKSYDALIQKRIDKSSSEYTKMSDQDAQLKAIKYKANILRKRIVKRGKKELRGLERDKESKKKAIEDKRRLDLGAIDDEYSELSQAVQAEIRDKKKDIKQAREKVEKMVTNGEINGKVVGYSKMSEYLDKKLNEFSELKLFPILTKDDGVGAKEEEEEECDEECQALMENV